MFPIFFDTIQIFCILAKNNLIIKKKQMAKYKLIPNIAGSKSFRFDGKKYVTRLINQKVLKTLFIDGCVFVTESKESKKPVKNEQKENNKTND